MSKVSILIIGSNGMVGQDLLRLFECESNELYKIVCCNRDDFYQKTCDMSLYDVIFNCANDNISKLILSKKREKTLYIDNSSYLRMNPDYPLVIPEVNFVESNVYANPNCVTIILCLFLNAIKIFNPKNIEVTTYQAISGAGKDKFKKFLDDSIVSSGGIDIKRPLAGVDENKLGFNFYPHETPKDREGFSGEERKVINETKKITGLDVFPTCIRIPAVRCHGEVVMCEFGEDVSKELLIEILKLRGILYKENPEALDMEMSDKIMVGHIRKSPFRNRWSFFVVGDQLTRGASYNAYKIFKNLK